MFEHEPKNVEGIQWGNGLSCDVKRDGMRTPKRVLIPTGVSVPDTRREWKPDSMRVCFATHVAKCQAREWFESSIPLVTVMGKSVEVLLAHEMKNRASSPTCGYPSRVVISEYPGGRQVQWVDTITTYKHESQSLYQEYCRVWPSMLGSPAVEFWGPMITCTTSQPFTVGCCQYPSHLQTVLDRRSTCG